MNKKIFFCKLKKKYLNLKNNILYLNIFKIISLP